MRVLVKCAFVLVLLSQWSCFASERYEVPNTESKLIGKPQSGLLPMPLRKVAGVEIGVDTMESLVRKIPGLEPFYVGSGQSRLLLACVSSSKSDAEVMIIFEATSLTAFKRINTAYVTTKHYSVKPVKPCLAARQVDDYLSSNPGLRLGDRVSEVEKYLKRKTQKERDGFVSFLYEAQELPAPAGQLDPVQIESSILIRTKDDALAWFSITVLRTR